MLLPLRQFLSSSLSRRFCGAKKNLICPSFSSRCSVATWTPLAAAFNRKPEKKIFSIFNRQRKVWIIHFSFFSIFSIFFHFFIFFLLFSGVLPGFFWQGLFGNPLLADSVGFYLFKEQAEIDCERLVREATSSSRKRNIVEICDEISNTLCRVADMVKKIHRPWCCTMHTFSGAFYGFHLSGGVYKRPSWRSGFCGKSGGGHYRYECRCRKVSGVLKKDGLGRLIDWLINYFICWIDWSIDWLIDWILLYVTLPFFPSQFKYKSESVSRHQEGSGFRRGR